MFSGLQFKNAFILSRALSGVSMMVGRISTSSSLRGRTLVVCLINCAHDFPRFPVLVRNTLSGFFNNIPWRVANAQSIFPVCRSCRLHRLKPCIPQQRRPLIPTTGLSPGYTSREIRRPVIIFNAYPRTGRNWNRPGMFIISGNTDFSGHMSKR